MPSLWGMGLAPSLERCSGIIISVVMEIYSNGLLVSLMCFGSSCKPVLNPVPFLIMLNDRMLLNCFALGTSPEPYSSSYHACFFRNWDFVECIFVYSRVEIEDNKCVP